MSLVVSASQLKKTVSTERKYRCLAFLPADEVAGRQCFQSCLSVSHSVHGVGGLPM